MKKDWQKAQWAMYDHIFYDVSRKDTLRNMLACGLSAREALEEMRSYERRMEYGL